MVAPLVLGEEDGEGGEPIPGQVAVRGYDNVTMTHVPQHARHSSNPNRHGPALQFRKPLLRGKGPF